MPAPDVLDPTSGRTRRQALGIAGALAAGATLSAVSGCQVRLEQEPVVTPPPKTPDELARERAAAETDRLLALLDDVRQVRPDAAALLGRIATDHQAHLAALLLPPSSTTPLPKATATGTGSATPTDRPLAAAAALGALAARETAATEHLHGELATVSGELARLLSGIAASLACHADALTAFDRARPA